MYYMCACACALWIISGDGGGEGRTLHAGFVMNSVMLYVPGVISRIYLYVAAATTATATQDGSGTIRQRRKTLVGGLIRIGSFMG
jgi:hypothetical protein